MNTYAKKNNPSALSQEVPQEGAEHARMHTLPVLPVHDHKRTTRHA
jgi:hypothetical protein